MNVQKTYYMVFHRSRIKIDTHAVITMDNVCLQRADSFKYLGVIINHKLNWTQHIDYVNPLLHAIRNYGIRFFSFWNSKENVSNKVIPKKKIFCCTQLCTVRHNGTNCSNHQNLKMQKINVSYVYYHIQMTTNVTYKLF